MKSKSIQKEIKKEFYKRFNNDKYEGTMWFLDENIDKVWRWIAKKLNERALQERQRTLEEVREKVIRHINNNWHASLGYGEDKRVYERALDELGWITEPLGITLSNLINKGNE